MKQLINIDVPDIAAAETFYSQAFGLRTGRRLGSEVLEMRRAALSLAESARQRRCRKQ